MTHASLTASPAKEGAFTVERFTLDWDRRIATCPAGRTSESWIPDTDCGHERRTPVEHRPTAFRADPKPLARDNARHPRPAK